MNVKCWFIRWGFLLFPFVSLPFLPGNYKPISTIIFSVGFFLMLILQKFRVTKFTKNALALYFVIIFISLISILVNNGGGGGYLKELLLLSTGFFTVIFIYEFVNEYGLREVLISINYSIAIFCAFSLLEVLSVLFGFHTEFNTLISGRSTGRFQVTTSEASWAARIALFYLPFALHFYKKKYKYSAFYVTTLFTVVAITFSIEVLFYLFIGSVIWWLFAIRAIQKKFLFFALFCIFLLSFFVFFDIYILSNSDFSDAYYISRLSSLFKNIYDFDFMAALMIDESVFVRVIYPVVSLDVFISNFWFGVSMSGYPEAFNLEIAKYTSYLVFDREVSEDIINLTGDPRFLFGKFCAYFGISGVFFFLIIFFKPMSNSLKTLKDGEFQYIAIATILASLSTLQFGSFAYLPLLVCLALQYYIINK